MIRNIKLLTATAVLSLLSACGGGGGGGGTTGPTPTPVVDLKALLNKSENSTSVGRFVSLKFDDRHVAIGVDSVIGLRYLNSAQLGDLPPLLRDVTTDRIESFGIRDAQLLLVLHAARTVPGEVWKIIAEAEASP
jgi:purine-binding chemotaxis protein CheW